MAIYSAKNIFQPIIVVNAMEFAGAEQAIGHGYLVLETIY